MNSFNVRFLVLIVIVFMIWYFTELENKTFGDKVIFVVICLMGTLFFWGIFEDGSKQSSAMKTDLSKKNMHLYMDSQEYQNRSTLKNTDNSNWRLGTERSKDAFSAPYPSANVK